MAVSLVNGSLLIGTFLALTRQTWGIIGAGGVLVVIIVAIIFYMLGSHSERH